MAVAYAALIVEGFDSVAAGDLTPRWLSQHGTAGTIIAGRNRQSAMRISAVGGIRKWLDSLNAGTAFYDHPLVGVAFRTSNMGGSSQRVFCLDSGSAATGNGACEVNFDTSGHIQIVRNGTIIATGTTVFAANTWYYIEAKVLIATTAVGSYEIRVNGVTELGPTSSVQTSSSTVNLLRLVTSASSGSSVDWDDLVVQDWSVANVDFLGDVSVATLYPDGAGNYTQFTPSTGSNYQNVDDPTANGDTDYNSDATVSDRDSFSMSNLPSNGTPYIVQATTEHRKDDAGSRTLRQFLRVGGANYEGTSQAVSDSYVFKQDVWNSDPSGGTWNQSKVDALEAGYKVQA